MNDIEETIHLAVVACGERLEEPQIMIKSAVLLTQAKLHVHIFADDGLRPQFKTQASVCAELGFMLIQRFILNS